MKISQYYPSVVGILSVLMHKRDIYLLRNVKKRHLDFLSSPVFRLPMYFFFLYDSRYNPLCACFFLVEQRQYILVYKKTLMYNQTNTHHHSSFVSIYILFIFLSY